MMNILQFGDGILGKNQFHEKFREIDFTKNIMVYIPNPGRYIGALLADFLSVHSQVTTGSGNLLLFAFGIMGDMFSFCRNLMLSLLHLIFKHCTLVSLHV